MKNFFYAVKIFVTVIFLCGMFLIGGKASAAEIVPSEIIPYDDSIFAKDSNKSEDVMEMFRETVMQTVKSDTRVFHQDILFILPKFTGELDFLGSTENDTLKMKGSFEIWLVDEKGNDEHLENPFYLVQDNKNMTLYFKDEKKWKKMTSPIAAADAVDKFATPTAEELEKMISFVKDVTVLQETEKSRTLLVKIDGGKIADELKAIFENDPEFQKTIKPEDMMMIKMFGGYFESGLRNADIWYTWTVDKFNWQTTTMSFNLSGLVQSVASAVLNDRSQNFTNDDAVREILETLAFYSEFKGYTTFLNPAAKATLELPKNVQKAKEVDNFTDDKKSKKK